MILKKSDDRNPQIAELENILKYAPENKKSLIQKELNILRAGIKGEQESIYHIDFNLGNNKNYFVIHDLRLEINGIVAQIDHLLINRTLDVFSLETKHFNSGIKINDDGEFMQWNAYKKTFEGIPSPLAQNQRHIKVLQSVFQSQITIPTKFGFTLNPSFHSRVLVNNDSRIDRSEKYDCSELIKSEKFFESIQKDFQNTNLDVLTKGVSAEIVEDIGRKLIALHKPIKVNYSAKFGLDKIEQVKPEENIINFISDPVKILNKGYDSKINGSTYSCKKCGSTNIKIQYGRFGYYFKCEECEGNTNIKIECTARGHVEKLRKEGNKFFRECQECKTSSLFFEN